MARPFPNPPSLPHLVAGPLKNIFLRLLKILSKKIYNHDNDETLISGSYSRSITRGIGISKNSDSEHLELELKPGSAALWNPIRKVTYPAPDTKPGGCESVSTGPGTSHQDLYRKNWIRNRLDPTPTADNSVHPTFSSFVYKQVLIRAMVLMLEGDSENVPHVWKRKVILKR